MSRSIAMHALRARFKGALAVATVSAVVIVSSVAFAIALFAESEPPANPTTISDLAWMAGHWVLERPDGRLEEVWSRPVGDSMVGHFRWIRDGRLWITELLSITEEGDELVFRLRHFSDRMRPWENEDDPFTYRLSDRGERRAAFTIIEDRAGRPHRFVFESSGDDALLVRLEGEEDGRPVVSEFRYERAR